MPRYAIWDKQTDIYTLGRDASGKAHFTAEEYISGHAPWAANPNVKVIVGGGAINGTMFMEYDTTVDAYKKQGAAITDGMTDAEVLAVMEAFDDRPPVQEDHSNEKRIADALETLAANTEIEQIFAILEGDE